MPANTNPIFVGSRRSVGTELATADGTTARVIWTAGTNGSLIEAVSITSTDTSAVEVDLYLSDGATVYGLGSVAVAAGSGTDGGTTAPVNGLNQTELPWLRDDLTVAIGPDHLLMAAAHAAITAAKEVNIVVFGGDY
jgi:hypothetical protein